MTETGKKKLWKTEFELRQEKGNAKAEAIMAGPNTERRCCPHSGSWDKDKVNFFPLFAFTWHCPAGQTPTTACLGSAPVPACSCRLGNKTLCQNKRWSTASTRTCSRRRRGTRQG